MPIGEKAKRWKKFIAMLRKKRPHLRGENSGRWKGGVHPYNVVFKENKQKAIKRADGSCDICCEKKISVVHHIDENKHNHKMSNLIAVCYHCHGKLHSILYYAVYPDWKTYGYHKIITLQNKDFFL